MGGGRGFPQTGCEKGFTHQRATGIFKAACDGDFGSRPAPLDPGRYAPALLRVAGWGTPRNDFLHGEARLETSFQSRPAPNTRGTQRAGPPSASPGAAPLGDFAPVYLPAHGPGGRSRRSTGRRRHRVRQGRGAIRARAVQPAVANRHPHAGLRRDAHRRGLLAGPARAGGRPAPAAWTGSGHRRLPRGSLRGRQPERADRRTLCRLPGLRDIRAGMFSVGANLRPCWRTNWGRRPASIAHTRLGRHGGRSFAPMRRSRPSRGSRWPRLNRTRRPG